MHPSRGPACWQLLAVARPNRSSSSEWNNHRLIWALVVVSPVPPVCATARHGRRPRGLLYNGAGLCPMHSIVRWAGGGVPARFGAGRAQRPSNSPNGFENSTTPLLHSIIPLTPIDPRSPPHAQVHAAAGRTRGATHRRRHHARSGRTSAFGCATERLSSQDLHPPLPSPSLCIYRQSIMTLVESPAAPATTMMATMTATAPIRRSSSPTAVRRYVLGDMRLWFR